MDYIKINPSDNVAVALTDLRAGDAVAGVVLRTDVPRGHKIVLTGLGAGENVIKYGFPIGHVTRAVQAGEMIDHTCIKTNLEGLLEYSYHPELAAQAGQAVSGGWSTFRGYRRGDGQVGIRNEIWVIPTVGCVNGICEQIVARFKAEMAGQIGAGRSVDAVVAFPHNYGCSQLGDDHQNTRTVLADMVHHPNAGGVLVVSLGCENNQLDAFRELVGPVDESRVRMFVLGVFSDWVVARGGTTVLTEVPEMFGAETILMNRCQDRATFDKTVRLINDFKDYFICNNQPVYENPSPGNKAGGISTLEEKSLGCTQKCGGSPVRDVLRYGERLSVKGLNLLSAPGNDLVASTALAAAGCQLVLFTTGRGTPFGSFVPTMKIATNTALATRKPTWIDFNAGVLAQDEPMEKVAARFIDAVLAVAGGEPVNSEKNGFREIAIFKTGVTL